MRKVTLTASDGYKLDVNVYEVNEPKGYVQIAHGMEEHQERYKPFALELNKAGYTVITANMRGHGESAPTLGYFADKDGWKLLIEDERIITKWIKEEYKTSEVILFAHSMGTIITRNLMMEDSTEYKKVILSGYPNPQPAAGLGIVLAGIHKKLNGTKKFSKMLQDIAVGHFNKSVKKPKTAFDWLSFNEENVKNYMADPYCGHGFKSSALQDLFVLVKRMGDFKNYKDVNADLPILLLRGDSDPCTGLDKGSKTSIDILKNAGFKDIKDIKYDHMRHEILNEVGKEKVYQDIVEFIA